MRLPRYILAPTALLWLFPVLAGAPAAADPGGACSDAAVPCNATPAAVPARTAAAPEAPGLAPLPAPSPAAAAGAAPPIPATSATAPPPASPAAPAVVDTPAPPRADEAPSPPRPAAPPDPETLARAYRTTGAAPTIERATESLFPFGHVRPVLRCAPLRACAVELEAGELVLATSLGDSERWLLQSAAAGPGARTPFLVVKPTACDLSTNLLVATDRRIYEIALDSPPCRNADAAEAPTYNPHLPYLGVARFYYPDDLVRRFGEREQAARDEARRQSAALTPLAAGARLARLNFAYSWDRGRRWPWVPAQVFDDGEHTYIALPPAARLGPLPLLFALGPHGELALVNHQLDGDTLVADRVLDHAVLLVGGAKKKDEQRLEIVNRAFPTGAGAGGASSSLERR
jgi:P-type conjugative transfer protein TrbG